MKSILYCLYNFPSNNLQLILTSLCNDMYNANVLSFNNSLP